MEELGQGKLMARKRSGGRQAVTWGQRQIGLDFVKDIFMQSEITW
jgi:hypothetical protein